MRKSALRNKKKKNNIGVPVPGGQLIDFRQPVEVRPLSRNRKPGIV